MKQNNDPNRGAHAIRQPLPAEEIQRNAPHGKTADDLPETGELPTKILAKDIPATDVHDM